MTSRDSRTVYVAAGARGAIPTGVAFAVLFVALKLCHVIDWPWLWVLCPLWIPTVLVVLLLAGLAVAYVIASLVAAREREQYRRGVTGIQPNEHGPARRWPR